jgi:hypothetical protein
VRAGVFNGDVGALVLGVGVGKYGGATIEGEAVDSRGIFAGD